MRRLTRCVLCAGLLAAAPAWAQPTFEQPVAPLVPGAPVNARVSGLPARTEVVLVVTRRDRATGGRPLQSRNAYLTDAAGALDPARSASRGPGYLGVDAAGPFWSMSATATTDPGEDAMLLQVETTDGKQLAWARRTAATDDCMDVGGEFPGSLWCAPVAPATGAVIVLGGSEGGNSVGRAAASQFTQGGLAAFVMAYHAPPYGPDGRIPGLPASFRELPLESIERVRDWLRTRNGTRSLPIALWGVSKGGEMALAAADRMPWLQAVVAVVAPDVAWAAFGPGIDGDDVASGWSWRCEDLPFVPYRGMADALSGIGRGVAPDFPAVHAGGRADAPERVADARIGIRGRMPVLLLAGGKDAIWPSGGMSLAVATARTSAGLPVDVHVFAEAGHGLSGDGWVPTTFRGAGGDPAANAQAQRSAWRETLAFLHRHVGPGSAPPRSIRPLPGAVR